MSRVNRKLVLDALLELTDAQAQRRRWLSDGRESKEVSSFVEAVERLFSDSGLSSALKKGTAGFGREFDDILAQLDAQLDKIDDSKAPEEILNHPALPRIRELAGKAMRLLHSSEA